MIGRIAVISVAVLACAWFVLGIRQAQNLSRATSIVESSNAINASRANQAQALLSSAATLNPDRQIDIMRGIIALDRNQTSRAIRIFDEITRQEPMNVNAWVYLAQADFGTPQVTRVVAHIRSLDPFPTRR